MITVVLTHQRVRLRIVGGIVLLLLEAAMLCLPAFWRGAPLVYPDTRSYYLGGRAALDKVSALFEHHQAATIGGVAIDIAIEKARGVRSAFYALFAYLSAQVGTLWLVIALQAIIVALILRVAFRVLCPQQPLWNQTIVIGLLTIGTSLPWVVSIVMPDIFTPIMALCIILIILFWDRLPLSTRHLLFVGIAGSVVMHATNLPIALGLLVVGLFVTRRHIWFDRDRYVRVLGALFCGVVAMLAVGVAGFHQFTIAPQAPPFLLARSLADGPAKLYLRKHCPAAGLVMCNHLEQLDQSTSAFVWDPHGVYSSMGAEEAAQLRKEDKKIFIAATLAHPWMEARAMLLNVVEQLVLFPLHEHLLPNKAKYNAADMTIQETANTADPAYHKLWMWASWLVSVPEYLFVGLTLGWCIYLWYTGHLNLDQRNFVIMVLATVLIESFAGAIAEPAPRYEARVIWLIPLTALLFACKSPSVIRITRIKRNLQMA